MSKISQSPERMTFQRDAYIARCLEEGKTPNPAYLEMYAKMALDHEHRFDDPSEHKHNLEYDLRTTPWILQKVRESDSYAQNLYAALCNMQFVSRDLWPQLKEQTWSCSWRSAGGIIADMQGRGDYMDWYCSGIGGQNLEYEGTMTYEQWQTLTRYVPEGQVTEEIERDLNTLGWTLKPWEDSQ